jgi:hypothetical protein
VSQYNKFCKTEAEARAWYINKKAEVLKWVEDELAEREAKYQKTLG